MRFQREHLETLVAVVDGGTFDAAARALNVTPSAVSQRVKALEQEFGRVLVVRARPVAVTDSGAVLVRLARQQATLEREAATELGDEGQPRGVPVGVNADSMATWLLPALAGTGIPVELHRDDQEHTAGMLADGSVMAAVTSRAEPVPGCSVTRLGVMRYRAVASAGFVERWFPHGVDADALAIAPVVDFDRKDELQTRWLHSRTRRAIDPPRLLVPASADFARAVHLGMGWGMLPDAQLTDGVVHLGGDPIDVPLYWQQWNLRTAALDALREAVVAAATSELR
ncbi:MAG TPA: LysR family transcriptional regulator ArgP [Rhodoglobus sp.]|nr:LysR family transcriptional regulator ArgP [Rhodoglobus sp.]